MSKSKTHNFLAVFLIAVAVTAALIVYCQPHLSMIVAWASALALVAGSTVTYVYPVAGATAPTAIQALAANALTATIQMLGTDTTAVVTHNWGIAAAELARLFPIPILYQSSGQGTVAPVVQIGLTDSNSVTLTKASVTGSQGTFTIVILRPHSMVR